MTSVTSEAHWRQRSKCRTLTLEQFDRLFFPDSGRSIKQARKFCKGCPVKDLCLEFALNNNCVGIWAGTNYEERLGILAFQKITHAASAKVIAPPVVIKPHSRRRKKKPRSNFRAV